jgi:predicted ATPase/DNA-binding XRE family transcriptional regulator
VKSGGPGSFAARLRALREAAGFTQEELATIAGLSVHAVSALERGERRRPHVATVRALSAALDLTGLKRDAFVASARASAQEAVVDGLGVGSLPLPPTPLLGRDAAMQALRGWLEDPAVRLITLTGPGGAGKTRLALELARAIAAESATRLVFVPLAAVRNSAFVASAIAESLGLSDVTELDLPWRARAACGGCSALLVLDNFEQVLDAASLVADLLSSVPSLRVLITSRAPLRLRGEREFVVGPLALGEPPEPEEASSGDPADSPAVRLFLERVRDVRPDFRLTAANRPTVTEICRRLDGLPLALELAARLMKALSVEDLLRRLTDDVLLSTIGARDLPERQQTMNATVAWSYQLLGPDEQRAFRRLGALPGRFPAEAAAAVLAGRPGRCDETLDAVAGLMDRSLLLRAETSVPNRPLYQMLETVRAYAAHALTAAGERDEALERMARYSLGEASRAAGGLVGRAQLEWLNRVRDDLDLHRGALAWLIQQNRPAEASDIAARLMFFWAIRGHATEGLRWYGQILGLPSVPPAAESHLLVASSVLHYTQGELGLARSALTRAGALAHVIGDLNIVVQAENLLAHVEHAVGNLDAARVLFARSLEGFRALSLAWGIGNALAGMAWVALATGDGEQAERLLEEAALALEEAGPWFLLLTLYVRAILAIRRGDADEAIALARDSLTRIRDLQDKFAFVYALVPLAAAAIVKGDDAWAARILGVRHAVTERTGATVVDKSVDDLKERSEREARARLGPERWARAYAAGRNTSIDGLLSDIDRVLGQS